MYSDSWDDFRAECIKWARERDEAIIREWLEEIGFSGTIGYYISYDGIVTIYSNRCGVLIGKAGKNIDILKEILHKVYSKKPKKEWTIKFVENCGEFITI